MHEFESGNIATEQLGNTACDITSHFVKQIRRRLAIYKIARGTDFGGGDFSLYAGYRALILRGTDEVQNEFEETVIQSLLFSNLFSWENQKLSNTSNATNFRTCV